MVRLRLTSTAQRDLTAIREISVRDYGPKAARDFMAGFERIFQLLRDQPFAGQLRDEFGLNDRSFSYRPYRLLYQVNGDEILITRIIHQARDVRTARFDEQ